MASKSSSRQGLLENGAMSASMHYDADDMDTDSEEDEKPPGLHFGVWLGIAVFCGVMAILCAIYGLSMKDAGNHQSPPEHYLYRGSHGFVTSVNVRNLSWGAPARTAKEAILDAFPFGAGWANISFAEGVDGVMTTERVASWVDDVLLASSPFDKELGGKVPVPWPNESVGEQLGKGDFVGYSRRQVCFIVAMSLKGAATKDYDNFLLKYLEKTPCTPRKGSFGKALWNLLAACAADPGLQDNKPGPTLLVVKASKVIEVEKLHDAASYAGLADAGLRVCRYNDGATDEPDRLYPKGVERVPAQACTPPTRGSPGRDFMTGGMKGQAVQDISLMDFYGEMADCKQSYDPERLLLYMPEAAALLFFLREWKEGGSLQKWPFWLLGARQLMIGLDGSGRFDLRFELDVQTPMDSDVVLADLQGVTINVSASRPMFAFDGTLPGTVVDPLNVSDLDNRTKSMEVGLARRNRNAAQRVPTTFDNEVVAWYTALAKTSYEEEMQPTMRKIVTSVGAGPWLSGMGWGDSQRGMLAMWIAHAIAARTWGDSDNKPNLPLDYYIYSDFMENPGNQCFVLSIDACESCLQQCRDRGPEGRGFWLPSFAYMGSDRNETCVRNEPGDCGRKGYDDVIASYSTHPALFLWDHVKSTLNAGQDNTNATIFDLLLLSDAADDA